eukprot:16406-Chlamydomonas_euryale.AAC.1
MACADRHVHGMCPSDGDEEVGMGVRTVLFPPHYHQQPPAGDGLHAVPCQRPSQGQVVLPRVHGACECGGWGRK